MKISLLGIMLVFICSPMLTAQNRPDPNMPQGENLQVPEEWQVRLDHEMDEVEIGARMDSSDIYFVNMTPGWHITTGPAAIFYHPANTATGNFEITSEIHFFDPGDRNREAYGIFWGGSNLQNENQQYVYFLIRNTGEFLIKKRMGENTEVIRDWTESMHIVKYEGRMEESSVKNKLSVNKAGDLITFQINDNEVAGLAAAEIDNNGIFGLRVNHSINLHISDLSIVENN